MDQAATFNFVAQSSEALPGTNAEQATIGMDSNESAVNTVIVKGTTHMKNKPGNEKSQSEQVKKRKATSVPEKKAREEKLLILQFLKW